MQGTERPVTTEAPTSRTTEDTSIKVRALHVCQIFREAYLKGEGVRFFVEKCLQARFPKRRREKKGKRRQKRREKKNLGWETYLPPPPLYNINHGIAHILRTLFIITLSCCFVYSIYKNDKTSRTQSTNVHFF